MRTSQPVTTGGRELGIRARHLIEKRKIVPTTLLLMIRYVSHKH
jgi:hypothetical protein